MKLNPKLVELDVDEPDPRAGKKTRAAKGKASQGFSRRGTTAAYRNETNADGGLRSRELSSDAGSRRSNSNRESKEALNNSSTIAFHPSKRNRKHQQ